MKIRSSQAITLVEALVTVLLSSAILAAVYTVYITGIRTWEHYADDLQYKQNLRRAVTAMSSELREAKSVFITSEDDNIRLDFFRPETGMIRYSWQQEGKAAGRIVRTHNRRDRILAMNIKGFDFTQISDREVLMVLRSGPEGKLEVREKVALRRRTEPFRQKEGGLP